MLGLPRPDEEMAKSDPVLLAACLFALVPAALGQSVSAGIIGGVNVTQDFQNMQEGNNLTYSTPKRWIAGGLIEVGLTRHLSFEIDGLYHELEFTKAFVEPNGTLNSISPAAVVTWEFPLLAKYRFTLAAVHPFVEAGPAFRTSGNLNGSFPSHYGFTAGAGVEVRMWKLRIAPALRYSRWANDSFPPIAPSTAPNQVAILVSLSL
jgi:hypothetical protein